MSRHLRTLIIGAALIVGGNAVALLGVAYNRSGVPDAVVDLSQRELQRPYNFLVSKENSGLSLRLAWRTAVQTASPQPGVINGTSTPFLTQQQLEALGFDFSADPRDPATARRYEKVLPRQGFAVLEFNGPAYQAALQNSQANLDHAKTRLAANPEDKSLQMAANFAQTRFDDERDKSSRIFAIDVGPDPGQLRSRYPDRARYLILPCEVRLVGTRHPATGYITNLSGTTINVPLAYRTAIAGEGGARPTHYSVRLAYGKRAEPWIEEAMAE